MYGYGAIYQLLQVTQGGTTDVPGSTSRRPGSFFCESYTYDPVGNRLSSLGVSPYSYNPSNEMVSTPTAMYVYDSNGNMTSKTDTNGTTNYAWDYENRLAQVTLPGSGGTATFKYDTFGRRIYKSSSAGTSIFAYDGDNLGEEMNASGAVVARYTQGQNIDEPLAESASGATSYYEQDGLGSVTSLTNGSGALAQTYTFDSFGKLTNSAGSLTNPFQYTARESDPETGLYYYRARYYDPTHLVGKPCHKRRSEGWGTGKVTLGATSFIGQAAGVPVRGNNGQGAGVESAEERNQRAIPRQPRVQRCRQERPAVSAYRDAEGCMGGVAGRQPTEPAERVARARPECRGPFRCHAESSGFGDGDHGIACRSRRGNQVPRRSAERGAGMGVQFTEMREQDAARLQNLVTRLLSSGAPV
jgi:hypothetical protein